MNDLVTKSFANQCLAFPSRVDGLLAEIDSFDDAKGLLDQASAMQFTNRAASSVMWWHGDLLNMGYATYGELAKAEQEELSVADLRY